MDIPEYPLIVDWYDGEAVAWLRRRKRDESEEQAVAFRKHCIDEIIEGLGIERETLFLKERKRQRGLGQYERLHQERHVRAVAEQGLTFEVNLSDYLDTGMFLDHRNTRAMIRERAAGKRFLNLFAYTGTFTCYALDGGAASTLTVDLSHTYCAWTERNMKKNGFAPGPGHTIVQADCLQWLDNPGPSPPLFDLIVCDPPTFSNSKRMEADSFAIDRDHPWLIRACLKRMAPEGELFFSSNSRGFVLDVPHLPQNFQIEEITAKTVPEDFRNKKIHQCWIIRRAEGLTSPGS